MVILVVFVVVLLLGGGGILGYRLARQSHAEAMRAEAEAINRVETARIQAVRAKQEALRATTTTEAQAVPKTERQHLRSENAALKREVEQLKKRLGPE